MHCFHGINVNFFTLEAGFTHLMMVLFLTALSMHIKYLNVWFLVVFSLEDRFRIDALGARHCRLGKSHTISSQIMLFTLAPSEMDLKQNY